MADDRFSRFKNIEKGRAEEASGKPAAASGRFGALEKQPEAAPAAAAPSPLAPVRFTPAAAASPAVPRTLEEARRAAQAPSGLELAEVRPGDQPFVRCARCHIDSHALASTCSSCGTNLNTLEQQAFNERLWAEHRAAQEKVVEPAVAPESPAAPGVPVGGLDAVQQRALAEAMARELSARNKRSLGDFGGGGLLHSDESSFAGWFLTKVPPKAAHLLVVGAIVLSGALMAYKHTRLLGFVMSLVVGVTLLRLWMARN